MKLPDALNPFIRKAPERAEAYLSLAVVTMAVEAAVWTIAPGKKPHVSEAVTERVGGDAWDKRLEACDRAIARLAEKEGRDDFEKVVLGLPADYLNAQDDITSDIRSRIKTLTEELELTPIGFVPLHQAIVHRIKQDEGVPPSVILLEVGAEHTTMILYKVGVIVGRVTIGNDDLVAQLERALKGFKELEVLPSRVLLYGTSQEHLESYTRDLLKHPWPTRANFLHYPKIETLPSMALAVAVSLAGASELATRMGEDVAVAAPDTTQEEKYPRQTRDHGVRMGQEKNPDIALPEEEATREEEELGAIPEREVSKRAPDDNVVEVAPETLGFERDVDILEKPVAQKAQEPTAVEDAPEATTEKREELKATLTRFVSGVKLPRLAVGAFPKMVLVALVVVLLFAFGGWWVSYWLLPQAKVTILQVPQEVSESSIVTVNPVATVVDGTTKTVPGRKQERTVSGEKTIAVTGKKDLGDPSRGAVTVYNKSLSSKQLKKGTVITAGSLAFTIDSDVSVASASESIGSITFGKTNVAVTATKFGSQGNVPANTEFSVKDTSTSVMIARNDQAFSGGTSKVVTVVSRADYDALVEDLTKDLVAKAKSELGESVGGKERLIDETVKTTVTQKTFDGELDEEASQLHGSITVTISGISYSDDDVASLFGDLVASKVPSGYTLSRDGGKILPSQVQVKKDGTIVVNVRFEGQAIPIFDLAQIQTVIAGKSVKDAQEALRGIPGVGGVDIDLSRTLWGQRFPANAGNISLSVAVLE